MSRRTAGQSLVVGLLAAAVTTSGIGPAQADPSSDRGVTRPATGYADTFLASSGQEAYGDLTVFAPQGVPAFGRAEFSVNGYECLPEETDGEVSSVPGSVVGLTTASADGVLALTCNYHVAPDEPDPHLPTVSATATFDLVWTGVGPVEEFVFAGQASSCVSFLDVRQAEVTGTVRLEIPRLAVSMTVEAVGEPTIRQESAVCRPARR